MNAKPMQSLPDSLRPLWNDLERVLEIFGDIQDRLDPPRIPEFIDRLEPHAQALEISNRSVDSSRAAGDAPESLLPQAGSQLLQAASRFRGARTGPHEILKAFQALRPIARAKEILYPLADRYSEISEFFLTPARRGNAELQSRFAASRAHSGEGENHVQTGSKTPARGILNFNNQRGRRGGYTLYVPEDDSPDRAWPLVVALHGGSGHGADFFWSWQREARAYGFILAAPTSRDRTWSLHSPGVDAAGLNRMLDYISGKWRVDTARLLLTGISDGGTYSMLLSIVKQSPFTHYAPVAAAVHVLQNAQGEVLAPVRDKLIYQVHGARDWMFAVDKARAAADALKAAGARLEYSELDDLSHNYPRDENVPMLRWFCPELFE